MAERIIRQLIDDLDHTEILDGEGGSVEFALRGTTYRIDLSEANIAKLDEALAPFVEAAVRAADAGDDAPEAAARTAAPKRRLARRTTKRAAAKSKQTPKPTNPETSDLVRAWAAENGHEVNARGRVPAAVVRAYDAAQESAT